MYYALLADIVSSKRIKSGERGAIQEKLKGALEYVNEKYAEQIVSKFCITIGDEFQGILKSCRFLFEIISLIETVMYPVKLRFSAGLGEIYTPINSELPIGSDGPAWWAARAGMDTLKQKSDRGLIKQTNIIISREKPDVFFDLVNAAISLCCAIKEKWKAEHVNIIRNMLVEFGLRSDIVQKKLAERLNIAKYELNKKLKTMRYFDFAIAFEKIIAAMEAEKYE
jgi:hypothetical protein